MIRYALATAALKSFSLTPGTRTAYRHIGNVVETRRRLQGGDVPDWYLEEVAAYSRLMAKYQPVEDGDRVFELGTGFVHWESIVVKLFRDVQLTMFDVVDDRLWKVLPKYLSDLRDALPRLGVPPDRYESALELVNRLLRAASFEEVYQILGAEYILDSEGSTAAIESESYAMVISLNVMEHLRAEILPQVIADTFRMLRPGGYAVHQWDLSDHYSYFDASMARKNYLRFKPSTWDRWLNSRVMYINRVQRPEWDVIFDRAGFEIVETEVASMPLGDITVHPSYQLSKDDAQVSALRYVLRRPLTT